MPTTITEKSWIDWAFSFPSGTNPDPKKKLVKDYVETYLKSLMSFGTYKTMNVTYTWSDPYVIDANTIGIALIGDLTYSPASSAFAHSATMSGGVLADSTTGPTPPPPPKPTV